MEKPGKEDEKRKKFIGVHFKCCNVYQRVYMNAAGTGYWGACPKCSKQVRFVIGGGGTEARFFEAS